MDKPDFYNNTGFNNEESVYITKYIADNRPNIGSVITLDNNRSFILTGIQHSSFADKYSLILADANNESDVGSNSEFVVLISKVKPNTSVEADYVKNIKDAGINVENEAYQYIFDRKELILQMSFLNVGEAIIDPISMTSWILISKTENELVFTIQSVITKVTVTL